MHSDFLHSFWDVSEWGGGGGGGGGGIHLWLNAWEGDRKLVPIHVGRNVWDFSICVLCKEINVQVPTYLPTWTVTAIILKFVSQKVRLGPSWLHTVEWNVNSTQRLLINSGVVSHRMVYHFYSCWHTVINIVSLLLCLAERFYYVHFIILLK